MNRLTKKIDESIIESYDLKDIYGSNGRKCDDTEQLIDVYNKLGKLEDLEKQLGCPLDVIFKALTNGVYYEDTTNYMIFLPVDLCVNLDGDYVLYYDDEERLLTKNYKKTWWLKEDRSE